MSHFAFSRETLPGTEISDEEIKAVLQDDISRRQFSLIRKRIISDDLKPIIDQDLSVMFDLETYEDMRYYIDTSNNLMRRITKELSDVYREEHQRTITPKASEKRYGDITGGDEGMFSINQRLNRANFLLNGLNDLVFQIHVFGDHIDLGILTPDQITVFENPDNPSVIDAIAIEDSFRDVDGAIKRQWVFWSPTRHFIIDENYRKVSVPGNEEMISPYRDLNIQNESFFPFVPVHSADRDGCFFDENTGSDLIEATKLICIQNTFLNFMFPMQFKQISVQANSTDDGTSFKNNQVRSPLHILQTNGDMKVLDWQSDITKLNDNIERKLYQVAGNYGISAENFKLMANAQSGFARMIAKERLLEIRQDQIKIWRKVEANLFKAITAANNFYQVGPKISETSKFSIDYTEKHAISDPKEELEITQKEIDMGITSLVAVVKQRNPDLKTDKQAEEFIQKNIDTKNRLKSRFGLGDISFDDEQNQTLDAA